MLKLDTGGRLDKGLGRGSRPPEEVRFAIDSALEGDGFELSVPGRESVNIMESGLLSRKRGGSVGEPKVRIHLPPAESPSLSRIRFRKSRTPGFPRGVRGRLGGRVGRDAQGVSVSLKRIGAALLSAVAARTRSNWLIASSAGHEL